MEITITNGGIVRTFKGNSDMLQNNNWNDIMYHIIEDGLTSSGIKI